MVDDGVVRRKGKRGSSRVSLRGPKYYEEGAPGRDLVIEGRCASLGGVYLVILTLHVLEGASRG